MSSAAWKDLERLVCRALGAQRRPSVGARGWAEGSDDDGTCAFAVEVKRTTRPQLREAWLVQARRNGMRDGRPWLLVQRERHGSPRLLATLDFYELVALAQQAGLIGQVEIEPEEGGTMEDAGPQETPQPPTEPEPEQPGDDDGEDDSEDAPVEKA